MRGLILLLLVLHLDAATVNVDQAYGFNASDSTTFLQQALNGTADTIVIHNMGSPWISGALHLSRSNLTIRLEAGAELRAKSGAFPVASTCLLQLDLVNDIVLSGYGATLSMLNGTDAGLYGRRKPALPRHPRLQPGDRRGPDLHQGRRRWRIRLRRLGR